MSGVALAVIITLDTIVLIIVVSSVASVVVRSVTREILAAEDRELERRRKAGIQSGFTAGWHGGSGRR